MVTSEFGLHKFAMVLIFKIIWFSLVVHNNMGADSEAEEADGCFYCGKHEHMYCTEAVSVLLKFHGSS